LQPPDWIYFWLPLGYFGVFLLSLIGTASIIFPVPYTLLIFWFGALHVDNAFIFDPFLLMIVGGIGSVLGEFSGYLLGFYGRRLLSPERQRKMNYLARLVSHYGPVAIFIFALTPLPDDLLFIPLGMMRYSLVKTLIPALLGKMLMCYLLAFFGRTGGYFILSLFGEGGMEIGMIITTILLVIVIIILYRIDWEKVFEKYVGGKGEGRP